ncbi:conjugal transfer protein TraS [Streptomyces cellostaticus]|uniref:Conjugal transfer protein TraS n=1 Tax=Streptomyces cellostaticus TaxID=67285 RepID=A0A117PUT3_9ACTN|nr:FtsK/SpoIIIE domain-containing protein [Streptomyces cellostaticus]KUM93110.1 conjugal transfer protein TraS [Streptomyces cellostaticus]GHI06150.1 conjugal transfer protein TraS [Streptomyces cellostaticus]
MTGLQLTTLIVLALAAAGLGWLRWQHPASYWLTCGWLVTVARIVITLKSVMEACGLTEAPTRWRLWLAAATNRQPGRMTPRLRRIRVTRSGLVLRLKMQPGQDVQDFDAATERLRHAWRAHGVQVRALQPGTLEVRLIGYDVLRKVTMPSKLPAKLLQVPVALRADGSAHMRDFRTSPHELVIGATESGKSVYLRGLVKGLAAQPVALAGIDCKWGVELAPFARRLSALACTPEQAAELLDAMVQEMTGRYELIRAAQHLAPGTPLDSITSDIWGLPEDIRPVPLVMVIDEVAELFLISSKADEKRRDHMVTQLVRLAQLGRAAGIYLEVCGQRFGSELGTGATALRAQLTGRVAHRVNDEASAKMALADVSPRAVGAATSIAANRPGTAVIGLLTGGWARIRSPFVSLHEAVKACADNAHLTPDIPTLAPFRPHRTTVPEDARELAAETA